MATKHGMTEFSKLRKEAGFNIPDAGRVLGYCERTIYRWETGESDPRKAVIEMLRLVVSKKRIHQKTSHSDNFTFIDLFAGIGGVRKGFESIGGRCVFTSEWNRFSVQTYLANHACDHRVAGDITKVNEKDIPPHDLLLAGFPCQPFSLAGVSKKNALGHEHGFGCETQGTLFFDVARIIRHHQPRAFLLENVKNLLSHDRGRTFDVIRGILENKLGYHIDVRVIDAKSFVPQHRERIFIVGFREKNGFNFESLEIPDSGSGPRLRTILHPQDGSEDPDEPYTTGNRARVGPKYTLSDHLWGYLQDYAERHRVKGNGFGFGLVGPDDVARTLSARYYKDGSEILIRQPGRRNPRRLTPRECARLMGFDRPGDRPFVIPVSDAQAYRQFGNAVVVPVVEAVAHHMKPFLCGDAVSSGGVEEVKELKKVA